MKFSSVSQPFFQTVRNPVHTITQEHEAAGELAQPNSQLKARTTRSLRILARALKLKL